jgi:2'-5' RNA ligase
MPFAVELYMDSRADTAVRELWQSLVQAGISSQSLATGARPHISLCVYDSIDPSLAAKRLETFAHRIGTIPFQLEAVETFPGSNGVAFLAPGPSEELLEIQKTFHKDFVDYRATAFQYYFPEHWKPHCTLAEGISSQEIERAIAVCRRAPLPIRGLLVQIGLIEFRPIKEICVFNLGAS